MYIHVVTMSWYLAHFILCPTNKKGSSWSIEGMCIYTFHLILTGGKGGRKQRLCFPLRELRGGGLLYMTKTWPGGLLEAVAGDEHGEGDVRVRLQVAGRDVIDGQDQVRFDLFLFAVLRPSGSKELAPFSTQFTHLYAPLHVDDLKGFKVIGHLANLYSSS